MKTKKNKKQTPEEVFKQGQKHVKTAGKRAEKILGEFKEFVSRGNVTDMAVGVIVGTAFTAIVTSLVNDIITPLLGLIIGGIDFSSLSVTVESFIFRGYNVTLAYGNFIQSIIRFLIIAACVFFMVKTLNSFRRRALNLKEEDPPKPTEAEQQTALLKEIRDLLQLTVNNEQLTVDEPPTAD